MTIIFPLSLAACTMTMVMSWLVSQGKLKPVYILGIINSLCFITINGTIAYDGQPAVLFLIVPSVWAIITSVVGLLRLRKLNVTDVSVEEIDDAWRLTSTHPIPCDDCGKDALQVAIDLPHTGFVVHLCPLHLGPFLAQWMDCPEAACDQLKEKRPVTSNQ